MTNDITGEWFWETSLISLSHLQSQTVLKEKQVKKIDSFYKLPVGSNFCKRVKFIQTNQGLLKYF